MRSISIENINFDTHIKREISLIGSSTKYLNRGLRNMIKEKIEGRHKSEAMLEAKKRAISAQESINKEKIITLNTAQNSLANILKKRVIIEYKKCYKEDLKAAALRCKDLKEKRESDN